MTYDVIIIGGGPGGITAGIYACRQGLKTLLITKEFGGQMVKKATEVCNYPGFGRISGAELIKNFVNHAKTTGLDFEFTKVKSISKKDNEFEIISDAKKKYRSYSVILATGAVPKMLNVSGEEKYIGRGVSYCVTCDGPMFKDKEIAVVGGGNAGLEAAIFLSQYASKIYILEYSDAIKAEKENQETVSKIKNIEILTNSAIKEIKGEKFVNSIAYSNVKTGEVKNLDVSGVFIEIGRTPSTDIEGLGDLAEMNERKEVIADLSDFSTKTPGFYAVGDANNGKWKQIVVATGEGCVAALSASEYIGKLKKHAY